MSFFNLLTPLAYWLLIAMWAYILFFYLRRIFSKKLRLPVFFIPLLILAIDAFRTLVESIYFGAWYTSAAGLIPRSIHDFLVQPQNVFIPKAFNVVAACLVIGILLWRFIPEEEREIARQRNYLQQLEEEVAKRTEELTAAHNALSSANTQLRELDQLKSNFIDITSHELRTPLFCLSGRLAILKNDVPIEFTDLLANIEGAIKSANRLEKLIINTLKILEGEQYEKQLDLKTIPLNAVIASALSAIEPFIKLRDQRIIVADGIDLPLVEIDRGKIHDVFINLLMNAIKFTPDGGNIMIDVHPLDSGFIEVHVRDQGVGIDESDRPHIYEKFFTGMDVLHHASGEYEFLRKGFGLGLAIVKKFVEMHGGRVGMSSVAGKGSDFFFTIPLQKERDARLNQNDLAA